MNISQSCFLAPIHEPKFKDGLHFIKSYNQYYQDDHIFLVFSSNAEAIKFSALAKGLRYRSIVCNQIKSSGVITEKKYFGLIYIFQNTNFENVGVVDVDTEFFKTVNYSELFVKYNQRGILWGNDYEFCPDPMTKSPAKFFNFNDQQVIASRSSNLRVYFWFNDIPVYNRKYFLDFIKYINYQERCSELTWVDFDFMLYGYYLLLKGYFIIKPFIIEGNKLLNNIFIEDQYLIDPKTFSKLFAECRPMWIKKDIEPELMTQTFMHLHLDRLSE